MHIERFTNAEFDIEVLPRDTSFIVLASGLAKGLGYRDAHRLVESLPPAEKGYTLACTPGGDQRVWHVTEPGFYRVIGQRQTSRIKDGFVRDQVDRFQHWVFHDVLPSLRQHGHYSPPVPGNFPEPDVLTWDTAAAHLRQRYGMPIDDAIKLRERLTDAGVLRLTGTPRKEYRDLFWPVGRRFDIHVHALPILAGRVAQELYRLAEAQSGVQTALELDAVARRALEDGRQ
ncbi:BRO-N domain-containing protein [Streptomyces sparsogenes]|uniref:Prophage antirepressor n=1 Tax=Streptomyces sparsogenes DSM 40356 TaxID=1331668 RepID=A0A1R1S897_9ACTN|nr:BRO family protein [Streptomyces sparsogenes]OMI34453.1 prophage antirepressor [Streptomyces sparsogenes DSM 40356]